MPPALPSRSTGPEPAMTMTTGTFGGRFAGSHNRPASLAWRLSISNGSSTTPAGAARLTGGAVALASGLTSIACAGTDACVTAPALSTVAWTSSGPTETVTSRAPPADGTTDTVAAMMRPGPLIALNGLGGGG